MCGVILLSDDVSDGLTKSSDEDVSRGRRLRRQPLKPTDDEEQSATTNHDLAARQHRRQRSISFDA